MPAPVAIDPGSIQMPLTAILGGFTVLGGSVALVFRMLVKSHEKQIDDLTKLNQGVLQQVRDDVRDQWKAVERITIVRLMEISTFPHVAPQVKADAIQMREEIRDMEKRREP